MSDIDVKELLPCPFCGGDAEFMRIGTPRYSTQYACTECSCTLETGETFNHGEQWNTRADNKDHLALIDAVKGLAEKLQAGVLTKQIGDELSDLLPDD